MTARLKATLIVLFTVFCINFSSYSQSEKEIVLKYKAALQKISDENSIHSMELKGVFTIQKVSLPATIYYQKPNLRIQMTFQNLTFLQVSNDSIKWDYDPFKETNKISPVTKKTGGLTDGGSSFDFINYDLMNYEKLNHQLKVIGKEKMDSVEVYILELSKKDKTKAKIFVNTKNHLIYKVEDDKGYRCFANYSNTMGYVFPKYVLESKPTQKMEIHFDQLTFNKILADSLFIIPQHVFDKINHKKINSEIAFADSLYGVGDYAGAVVRYSKIIQKNDEDDYAYNARGLAKIALREYYEAIGDFNRAIELNPSAPNPRNNLGLAKYYLGDKTGAVKDYTKALELAPSMTVALKNRGQVYLEDENYELGAKDFSQAVKLSPEDGVAHFKLGVALAEQEKFDDALKAYAMAEKNKYKSADLYNYRGVSHYRLEKYDSAVGCFKRALLLEPDHLQYIENYGRSLYELGDYESAAEQFERFLKQQNDNASIHNLNGLCKYNVENFKGAIKDFSKSIELNGKDATYYDNRASAKEMIDDFEGAILDYGESIRIYPNDASVFYRRGLLKINTSKKLEGCLDLATANEMKYEPAKEAIMENCH